jgi:nucleotide-binding universal stress UspA family protein
MGGKDAETIHVEYAIREGKPAENIVNFAHAEDIDLLVISTHGSGGLSRWNISSVTHKVINLVYLPVLLIRAYDPPEAEMLRSRYRRILLPIDSSRRAECSLSAAIALARGEVSNEPFIEPDTTTIRLPHTGPTARSQTKLVLAAVIKPPELPIPKPYPAEIEKLSEQLMGTSRLAVDNYLNEMKERLPVDCETYVLENISVPSAIQELASCEDDIDLVVLCAHGYTGQFEWPYGSIARNYIEHGTKPVLVIQDVPRSQIKPSAAELAAVKNGGR